MRRTFLLLFIISLTVGGCNISPIKVSFPPVSTAKSPISVDSTTSKLLVTPTSSKIVTPNSTPIPSSTFTPTITPISVSYFGAECWQIRETFDKDRIPIDKLAIRPKAPEDTLFLLDFLNGSNDHISEAESLMDIRIAPNGKWLAGEKLEHDELIIIDSTGATLSKIPYQPHWGSISQWINNNTVIIQENDNYPLNTLYAVDPFTLTIKELPHLFPNMDKIRVNPWDFSGLTIYDPTMQLVVYPELSSDGNVIVLWDVQKNQPISRLIDAKGLDPNPIPRWTQNGDKFVFTGADSQALTLISRDGTIKQSKKNIDRGYISIIDWTSWSPDGRYLAFWIDPRGASSGLHLLIWDTLMDELIDTCLQTNDNIPSYRYPNLPVWSIDGNYLAIKSIKPGSPIRKEIDLSDISANGFIWKYAGEEIDQWDMLVVDFKAKYAVKIAEDAIPLGWMVR